MIALVHDLHKGKVRGCRSDGGVPVVARLTERQQSDAQVSPPEGDDRAGFQRVSDGGEICRDQRSLLVRCEFRPYILATSGCGPVCLCSDDRKFMLL